MKTADKPEPVAIKRLNNALLMDLSDRQIEAVRDIMSVVEFERGEMIIREGDLSDEVYLIQDGEVAVVKQAKDSGENYHLATLGAGESIGEVSLLDSQPRSASVITTRKSVLFRINMQDLNRLSSENDSAASRIKVSFAREMGRRLRKTNETTVASLQNKLEEARARVAMGTVICWLLVGICCYVLALQSISALGDAVVSTTLISVAILGVFGVMTLAAAKRSGYPLSFYGLTLWNWQRVSVESIVFSLPLIGMIVLAKWLLILFHPGLAEADLLDWSRNLLISPAALAGDILLYAVFTPVQEFIARGGVQSSFQSFLTNRYKNLHAILIANLMFSMTHIHLSIAFAVLVFLPGLFWGWLYYRQKSLLGVCISHILIGLIAYYVIGFQDLM